MKLKDLSKAIGIMAILLKAMFWGCSQEDEFEYETSQTDWNKTAMKKSLARSKLVLKEYYRYVMFFQYYGNNQFDAAYDITLYIHADTTYGNASYEYSVEFTHTPFNAPLTNERVTVEGSESNGNHHVVFTFYADWNGETARNTYNGDIPYWKL